MAGPKTDDNTQFARVAEATGLAPAGTTGSPGDGLAPLCDDQGRLLVVTASPGGGASGTVTNSDSAALESSRILLASAGRLLIVYGFNDSAADLYLQTFDQAGALAGGEVPVGCNLPVPAGEFFSLVPGPYGREFANGIVVGLSTTLATYTAPGAAAGWFNAQVQA